MFKKTQLLGAVLLGLFSSNSLPVNTLADTITSDPQTKGTKAMTTQTTTQMTPEMTPEQNNVLSLIEKMTSNFEQGNLDVVMSTYEKDAAIMFEPGTAVTDPAVAKQIFAEFSALNPHFTYSGHEVIVAGDIAVHLAPWSMLGKTPDGQEITQSGLSVAVLRQQDDGGWKMVIDNPHGSHLMGN
ncbi:YybH family protein [Kiloniella sp.]|uniref:YybH family protein n=1 Tax=Kiloniella sp. TaxID=1938587 RepID=UPI003B01AF5D